MLRPMYGEELVMDKETAIEVQKKALDAIEALHQVLVDLTGRCSVEDYTSIR